MEDIAQVERENDTVKGTFFAIFDGHGGKNAAKYAKKNLWKILRSSEDFASDDPEKVKEAIRQAFLTTHSNMWNVLGKTSSFQSYLKIFFLMLGQDIETLDLPNKLFKGLIQGGHARTGLLY